MLNLYLAVLNHLSRLMNEDRSRPDVPVAVNETAIDVVGALHSSNGLKTHSRGLVWHYVNEAVLKLVAGEIGTDES